MYGAQNGKIGRYAQAIKGCMNLRIDRRINDWPNRSSALEIDTLIGSPIQ